MNNIKLIFYFPVLILLLLYTVKCSTEDVKIIEADAAIYCGQGADQDCITASSNMFEWMGYSVELIKPGYINKHSLDNIKILCFPGGDMYEYSRKISSHGKEKIRNFLTHGGAYIGICGGAYFAGEKVHWRGSQLQMEPLGIFPGTAKGPVNEIVPYPYYDMCEIEFINNTHAVTLESSSSAWMLYYWGPVLIPDAGTDIQILAKYKKGKQEAAIAAFEYGEGRVFLIGAHPEFEEDDDRDGVTFKDTVLNGYSYIGEDKLNDLGSDWDLMERAADWCIKELD